MAEQILIDEGKKVVSMLINKGIRFDFAVWYTDPSTQSTFLALGAKELDELGPSKAYENILAVTNSIRDQLQFFKTDFFKLVSLESDLGKVFLNSFSNKTGDTMIGMLASPNFIFHQVYAYGLREVPK